LGCAKKNDESGKRKVRVVIDYRKLNEKTIEDKFPMPQIEEILDNIGQSEYFTTLDLKSGFHQILMDENSKIKTAFSTSQGHFEFNRMPFGLKNSPSTFQRAMNNILHGLTGTNCLVYLDDIIIMGNSLENHLNNLNVVLKRLADFNLKIQLDKCEFLKRETEFLGHVVTRNGVKTNPEKIKKILDWPCPKNDKEIKQFLGLAGYYRRFIKDYAKIVRPMTIYLKKDVQFNYSDPEFQKSFQKLKQIIASDQILAYPDFNQPFILTTDASDFAIGAVLS
jgi:Reverse transcriptase (RNA-dependent DNA polymerase)/RNase H-like domain found in reverse transcriptase